MSAMPHPFAYDAESIAPWINPNDKEQKQYLPHIGERVLFRYYGAVYFGAHTGGSFKSYSVPHLGRHFDTWECLWMYPPAIAKDAP